MVSFSMLPAPIVFRVEPVGKWFEKYRLRNQGIEEGESEEEETDSDGEIVLEEYEDLKNLDPKDWKDQDHYAVLGLQNVRYKASAKQIKSAHKATVLKHHPDKRKAAGKVVDEDNDYFSCITKAIEILGDKNKRRAYDSIDPTFNNDVPPNNNNSKQNFFEVFGPIFKENSRWSLKKNVPQLGDINTAIEDVDRFYNFWYNFESWREYSYLDEEDKEKAEDAYERRWMEKQNRAARQKRKKEEMQRIRSLVDNSYACDIRIKNFKDEQKRKKEEEKANRIAAAKKIADERQAAEKAKQEEERKKKAEEEQIRLQKQQEEKKQKDKEKKALKKERQKLKNFCNKHNYFASNETERIKLLDEVGQICLSMDLMTIQDLNNVIASSDVQGAEEIIRNKIQSYHDSLHEEKQKNLAAATKKKDVTKRGGGREWAYDELQILIKAVNLFPAGTAKRWEVVANYIETHGNCKTPPTAKECLSRAKNLQESDLKQTVNEKAFQKFQDQHKAQPNKKTDEGVEISQRYDQVWTSEEQKHLEQALKTYPASTPKRWDKIAEAVPNRTKRECMLRYKDLVEMVKAKKAVQGKK